MTHSRASGTLTHRADAIRHNVVVGLHAVTEINQTKPMNSSRRRSDSRTSDHGCEHREPCVRMLLQAVPEHGGGYQVRLPAM